MRTCGFAGGDWVCEVVVNSWAVVEFAKEKIAKKKRQNKKTTPENLLRRKHHAMIWGTSNEVPARDAVRSTNSEARREPKNLRGTKGITKKTRKDYRCNRIILEH
jgi:hypothetical protein